MGQVLVWFSKGVERLGHSVVSLAVVRLFFEDLNADIDALVVLLEIDFAQRKVASALSDQENDSGLFLDIG